MLNRFAFIALFAFNLSLAAQNTSEVVHHGALRNIMHKGDLSAHFDLSTLENTPFTYALGAVEGLDGEILIYNGDAYIAQVRDQGIYIDRTFEHKASLLVQCQVRDWMVIALPSDVQHMQDLEQFITSQAEAIGVDSNTAFPFLLSGELNALDWHVIQWDSTDNVHTHEKHKQAGLHGQIEDTHVEVVGFYSNHHKGIFTHHSSKMHMHVKTGDEQVVGHVDDIALGEGMVLLLPNDN